eukprot:10445363-Alexandrium_andersonii.AAC.1
MERIATQLAGLSVQLTQKLITRAACFVLCSSYIFMANVHSKTRPLQFLHHHCRYSRDVHGIADTSGTARLVLCSSCIAIAGTHGICRHVRRSEARPLQDMLGTARLVLCRSCIASECIHGMRSHITPRGRATLAMTVWSGEHVVA